MNRGLKILLLAGVIFGLFIFTASAANTASLRFTNPETSDITISGHLDGVTASNVYISFFVLPADKNISSINDTNDGTVQYVGAENLDLSGDFTHLFRFSGEPRGDYKLIAYVDGVLAEIPFSYLSWEEIKSEVLGKIKDGAIAGEQIYDTLEKYRVELDIDIQNVTSSRDKNILIKRVSEQKSTFSDKYAQIINDIQAEITLLNDIQNAEYWSVVEAKLRSTASLTGISFAGYDSHNDKAAICNQIKGSIFVDYNQLIQVFYKIISETPSPSGPSVGPGVGGGGYSGGGGSFSSGLAQDYPKASVDLAPAPVFSDIADYSWAAPAITYLYDLKIVNGTGNGLFAPSGNVKREEFVKMCVLAFDLYDGEAKCDFSDVSDESWAYSYIASAVQSGIINGITDSEFGFSNNITRQEIAAIIYRYKSADFSEEYKDFSDFDDIADYAKDAVARLAGDGIINGMGDGRFEPNLPATRAQAAKMIFSCITR